MSMITFPGIFARYCFIDFDMLITLSTGFLIYTCLRYRLLHYFLNLLDLHIFLRFLLSDWFSFLSLHTLSLWRFLIFIPFSQCNTTWLTKKRKRTWKVFLIESVMPMYKHVYIRIHMYIDNKRTVRGVTFFLLWLGRHTTVVTKTGSKRMKYERKYNHGMKGRSKTCELSRRSEITSIGFWVSLKRIRRGVVIVFFSILP